jgi:hypothetical protein
LRVAIGQMLPHAGLRLVAAGGKERWTPRLLVLCILLMAFDATATLGDRFAAARRTLVAMYPSRRRPGDSCQGFFQALRGQSAALLECVCQALRQRVCLVAQDGRCWQGPGLPRVTSSEQSTEPPASNALSAGAVWIFLDFAA